ncbi:hypothetical protein [Aurantiacibacter gilvus]|uniref:Uncharacterized protein n=1 Tax=Aurantiacibacter gilvus TaxID=3139141 RepID=A0ABU9IDF1_9SPHN
MGTPASSALRADNAPNAAALSGSGGDGFGSLTGLGGPKKFKKKPVLVLDPEELERAHMLFQEASAELLGEEAERAPKPPAPALGLAPMNDRDSTPEDMGLSDDDQDGGDDEAIPSAEDLLKMTSSRRVEDEEEQEYAMRALEEGFDEEHRIFPTLPVLPAEEIAYEEAADLGSFQTPADDTAELPETELPGVPVEAAYNPASGNPPPGEPSFKLSPLSVGETGHEDEEEEGEAETSNRFAALSPQIRRKTPIRPPEAVEAAEAPAPEAWPEPLPASEAAAEPEPVPEPAPTPEPEPLPEQLESDPWSNETAPVPEDVAPLPAAEPEEQAAPELDPEPETKPETTVAFEPTPRIENPRIENAPEDLPASRHVGPFEHQRAERHVEEHEPMSEEPAPVPGFEAAPLPPAQSAPEERDELPPVVQEAAEPPQAEAPLGEPEQIEPPQAEVPLEKPEQIEPPRPFVADDGPRWQPESYDAPQDVAQPVEEMPEMAEAPETGFDPEEENFDEHDEASGNYTLIEDEPVDGYAFMQASSPRGRAIRVAAPGEANSLRARLIRERGELQAEAERAAASRSIVMRFWNWLRGLFG